jgi:hypothetical protein
MENESIACHHFLCEVSWRGPSRASRHNSCSSSILGDANVIGDRDGHEVVPNKAAIEGSILLDLGTDVGSLKNRYQNIMRQMLRRTRQTIMLEEHEEDAESDR